MAVVFETKYFNLYLSIWLFRIARQKSHDHKIMITYITKKKIEIGYHKSRFQVLHYSGLAFD